MRYRSMKAGALIAACLVLAVQCPGMLWSALSERFSWGAASASDSGARWYAPLPGRIRDQGVALSARRGGRNETPQDTAEPSGEGAGAASEAAGADPADPKAGGLEVTLGEWVVILEADAIRPGPVTFVVKNRGVRGHGFRVRSEGGRGRDRFEARTAVIPPGAEATLAVNIPAGQYRVDCFVEEADVGDHAMLGMRARLTVRPDAPLAKPLRVSAPSAVQIERFSFTPSVITVSRGTTVVWTNRDAAPHTVTSETGVFDSGALPRGGEFRHRFDAPGEFPYKCLIHPAMTGTVKVE